MGSISTLEYRPRHSPESPPELASPSASSSSSRSSPSAEALAASQTLLTLPYGGTEPSHYDQSRMPSAEPSHRVEHSPKRPTTLPSLSSLFGPGNNALPPLRSPELVRTGPLPSPASPFFSNGAQSNATAEYHYRNDRQLSLSTPQSPNFPPDTGRAHEYYSLEPAPKPFKKATPRSQVPGSPSSRKTSISSDMPDTPRSSAMSDGGYVKRDFSKPDINRPGPKIWTGTSFLPRFIKATQVEGEGLCYFYDDGTQCNAIIDGEEVNPYWGVTKANKPRKRLAVACLTCREKKIKCDPDFPRCSQCAKFGRDCVFKNAPRGKDAEQTASTPAEPDTASTKLLAVGSLKIGSDLGSPGIPYHLKQEGTSKRMRLDSIDTPSYISSQPSPIITLNHTKSPLLRNQMTNQSLSEERIIAYWRVDPCVQDLTGASKTLTEFFIHADATMLMRFVPERIFKAWAADSAGRKSSEDLMVIYSMLAFGTVLSEAPRSLAAQLAQVAKYAQGRTRIDSIQAVQGRLLLAAYHATLCNTDEAAKLITEAAESAAALQLNLELDQSAEASRTMFPFGLNRIGYSEARRRTFWALFIFERLCGVVPAQPPTLNPNDIHIRLPMDTQSFEQQVERDMPFFQIHNIGTTTFPDSAIEVHSALVKIVYLWGECQQAVYNLTRDREHAAAEEGRLYEISARAAMFRRTMCARMAFSTANLETACYSGNMGALMLINSLYHQTIARANRYHLLALNMTSKEKEGHLVQCRTHSDEILKMLIEFEDIRARRRGSAVTPLPLVYAAVEAVDIVSGSGQFRDLEKLLKQLNQVRAGIEAINKPWDAAEEAAYAIGHRRSELDHVGSRGPRDASPGAGYKVWADREANPDEPIMSWSMAESLGHQFPKHMDIIYCDF